MSFTPDADCLPDRISPPDSIVLLQNDEAKKDCLAINGTSHVIQLKRNRYSGNIAVKSITSVHVEKVITTKNYELPVKKENIKIETKVSTLEDYSSDSSLINHQVYVIKVYLSGLTVQ